MLKKLMRLLRWTGKHKYIFVTVVFLLIIFVFDENNLVKQFANRNAIAKLEREIEEMKRDSVEIVKKQMQLEYKGDIDAIERLAREKYGMHKDNEEVFVIE